MKKVIAFLVAALMVVSICACGNSSAPAGTTAADGGATEGATEAVTEAASQGGETAAPADDVTDVVKEINIGVNDVMSSLSPWLRINEGRHVILYSIYQPLMERNKTTGEAIMIVAESFEKISDQEYEIKIRENIEDSEGNHFTAADAVYSINGCIAEGNVSGLSSIEGAELIDDYKLKVTMTTDTEFQFVSSMSTIMMVTQAAYEASADQMATKPISTAPYEVTAFEAGSSCTIQKKENYWGADLADPSKTNGYYWFQTNVDTVNYTKISEATQQSVALEKGEIDLQELMKATEAARFEGNADYNVFNNDDVKTYALYYNGSDGAPLSSKELREAICYAVDVEQLVKAIGHGMITYTFGSPLFSDYLAKWEDDDYFSVDLAKAQDLVKASGYAGQELKLFYSNGDENCSTIAPLIQAMCAQAGITITLNPVDSASFSANVYDPSYQDIRIEAKGFENLAELWKQDLGAWKSLDGKNHCFIIDDELEKLIDGMRFDDVHTDENVDACHQYIKDNAIAYGLFGKYNSDVSSKLITDIGRTCKLYILPGACTYDWSQR